MDRPQYTALELKVMQMMAHGRTREEISRHVEGASGRNISPSTVARLARSATDKAVPEGNGFAPIIHGVAVLVAQGQISVQFGCEKRTSEESALAFIDRRIHSCMDWQEFEELRAVYAALRAGHSDVNHG